MYDPFTPYDAELDAQVAAEMGFDTVQEMFEFLSLERENGRLQIKKDLDNGTETING